MSCHLLCVEDIAEGGSWTLVKQNAEDTKHMKGGKICNKFDLRSYREIDVITSNACVVLLITQAIASRNDIMTVDRT